MDVTPLMVALAFGVCAVQGYHRIGRTSASPTKYQPGKISGANSLMDRSAQSPNRGRNDTGRRGGYAQRGRVLSTHESERLAVILSALTGAESQPRRDLLIEYLHAIQDAEGGLPVGLMHALADWMRLPQTEIFEVASFYSHFHILADGETAPVLTIRVCESLSCEMAGAEALIRALHGDAGLIGARVVRAPCMGRCDTAPVCEIGRRHLDHANTEKAREIVSSGEYQPLAVDYQGLHAYQETGGYQELQYCLTGTKTREHILATLERSGLRGLGGAGFPTARKWSLVRAEPGPRYLAVNADEGEVGTCKDRYYLEREPHRFLEGVAIAAWMVEAQAVYIYLRDEYPAIHRLLGDEIQRASEAGWLSVPVHLRRGAGAYICGEESAMIESIEGKRGLPRHRPPYVAQCGLFNRPTLVNNVKTLYWIPEILAKGGEWFASQGKGDSLGLRSYSVSGRVREPGVKIAPAGSTVRELIENHCGGMAEGHVFTGYLPGGASGGILPAALADVSLDFGQLEEHGCFVGSHAVIVFSDQDDVRDVARSLMRFFEHESCGQCTPCRNGTEKAVQLMAATNWDRDRLRDLSQIMRDASICGLGQAAPNPLDSVFRFFADELEQAAR